MAIIPNGDTANYQNANGLYREAQGVVQIGGTGSMGNKFREAFESYDPVEGGRWTQTLATGDIIAVDGNVAAASYLVISKDPFQAGTESRIATVAEWNMPFDAAIGLSISQRTLGQEFSVELVSAEAPMAAPADLVIASIQQAASVLTISTTTPHGLRPGMRIGIANCQDSRLNYPAIVVATTPSAIQFTATAGPSGNLPSVTAGPFATGVVFFRSAIGSAPNGSSMIFENPTATNASFYVRAESGDVNPSGVMAGNHSVSPVGTTASVQAINAAFAYAFQPTNEFRLSQFVDGLQWSDVPVDSLAASNNRHKRTQIAPDINDNYRFRVRATNVRSLTVPVGHIQSVTKTASATAIVVMQTPHGLTMGDVIAAYGVRDQTNFANLTAATAITSIVDANTFTVTWGGVATIVSQAGIVYRVNGGNLPSALGAIAQVVHSVVRTNNVLTLAGNATWAGLLIGDYINLAGLHDTTGAELNLDGPYRIRNLATTTLEVEPVGGAPTGADILLTNCGGAVVKRTDMRISYVRVLDFERHRVEFLSRPQGDISQALSVNVQNAPAVTVSSGTLTQVWTVSTVSTVSALTGGGAAEDAAAGANPIVTGGVVRTAVAPTTLVAGDAARVTMTSGAAQVMRLNSAPELSWQVPAIEGGIVNTTTPFQIRAAAGALIRNYCSTLDLSSDALTNATSLRIREPDITCSSQTIASNTLTTSAVHDLAIGDAIVFSALANVTGVTVGVTYFVLTTPATTTITLAASSGGTVLTITGTTATATFHKVLWQTRIPTTGVAPRELVFKDPLRGSVNRALLVQTVTASGAGGVYLNAQGHIAP